VSDTLRGNEVSSAVAGGPARCGVVVAYSPDTALMGQRIELNRSRTLFVGRKVPGGLSVNDERMSKQHFLIVSTKDELACRDAGSTNGTFVDGEAPDEAPLQHGSVIRAGNTLFVVETQDAVQGLRHSIARAAPTSFPILLLGETGTGKELMARSIHEQSRRRGPFVALNCATLPRELAGAELFGHARGAFSGASAPRDGLFRAAHEGTLFLDEIGDLPSDLQPAFLRVLEEKKVRPLGSDQELPIDVRVLAATHVDLEAAARQKAFRADLLARLAHIVLRLPPLRERRGELFALCHEFAPSLRFSANAAEAMLLWSWPRNVRELRTLVEAAGLLSAEQGAVSLSGIQDRLPAVAERLLARQRRSDSPGPSAPPPQLVQRREQLHELLVRHEGNVSKVAEELGKPRAQIYRWANTLGLDVDGFRRS
jgi:DNA-binding NtrC family response regulator